MELKPCPFCGGNVDFDDRGKIQCGRACIGMDIDAYANEWNARPLEDALKAKLDAAIQCIATADISARRKEELFTILADAREGGEG